MSSRNTIHKILEFASKIDGINLKVLRDGFEMAQIHHRLDQAIENDLAGLGLTPRQVEIMETIFHNDDTPITPAYLADEVGLTRSAITSALDSLEQAKHIIRKPHPSDRRMLAIALTPSGKKFIEEHLHHRYTKMNWIVGHFTAKERKFLLNIYKRLLDIFESSISEDNE